MKILFELFDMKASSKMILKVAWFSALFAFLIPFSFAHIPITGEGYSLSDAVVVGDPLKSWVIYAEYKDARPLYYKFNLTSGDRLKAGLLTVDRDFVPDLTIMGLGLPTDFDQEFHDEFEIPDGYGLLHFHGEAKEYKDYEPFTPSSYYQVLSVDLTANETGTYYLVADAAIGSGKVGIVIGYIESFTLYEWLKVPFDVAYVHHWEGQDYLIILLPMILIVCGGLLLNCYFSKKKLDLSRALAFVGSLTYLGSAAIIFTQMIISLFGASFNSIAFITPIFILLPGLMGYLIFREVRKAELNKSQKARMVIYGLLGLFFWAGYIIGPVLVIIGALISIKRAQTL